MFNTDKVRYYDNVYKIKSLKRKSFFKKFDEKWEHRQRVLYFNFKIDYINKYYLSLGYIPVFFTITLPSEFHSCGIKKDVDYGLLTPKDGYNYLQYIHRYICRAFRVNRRYVGVPFIKVVEPHKDFTPHAHIIYYVRDFHLSSFINFLKRVKHKFKLEQTDLKVLDAKPYAVTYLLKYVNKSINNNTFIRGWCLDNKIRMFSTSRTRLPFDLKLFRVISRFLKFDKSSDLNYFEQILEKVTIYKEIHYKETGFIKNIKHIANKEEFVLSCKQVVYLQPKESNYMYVYRKDILDGLFRDVLFKDKFDYTEHYKYYKYSEIFLKKDMNVLYFYDSYSVFDEFEDIEEPLYYYQVGNYIEQFIP